MEMACEVRDRVSFYRNRERRGQWEERESYDIAIGVAIVTPGPLLGLDKHDELDLVYVGLLITDRRYGRDQH